MEGSKRFGETYRTWATGEKPEGICEVCGGELEMDPESGEQSCPSCDNPEP